MNLSERKLRRIIREEVRKNINEVSTSEVASLIQAVAEKARMGGKSEREVIEAFADVLSMDQIQMLKSYMSDPMNPGHYR